MHLEEKTDKPSTRQCQVYNRGCSLDLIEAESFLIYLQPEDVKNNNRQRKNFVRAVLKPMALRK